MNEQIFCRHGKCIDLKYGDCESAFDNAEDVNRCETQQEQRLVEEDRQHAWR